MSLINPKCAAVSAIAAALYWTFPHRDMPNSGRNTLVLLAGTYIGLAWYDAIFDCDLKSKSSKYFPCYRAFKPRVGPEVGGSSWWPSATWIYLMCMPACASARAAGFCWRRQTRRLAPNVAVDCHSSTSTIAMGPDWPVRPAVPRTAVVLTVDRTLQRTVANIQPDREPIVFACGFNSSTN